MFDGMRNDMFLMDLPTETATYANLNNMTFGPGDTQLQQFILTTPVEVLQHIATQNAPETFPISSPPQHRQMILHQIVKDIEPEIHQFEKNDRKSVLPIFMGLARKLINLMKFKPLHEILGKYLHIPILHGGFSRILAILSGITKLLHQTSGKILKHFLNKAINIHRLFASKCSIQILAEILKSIKNDASTLLEPIIRFPIKLYQLIHEFGGGIYRGLHGIEALISHLILFAKRRISLQSLMDILIQIGATIGKFSINKFKNIIGYVLSILKSIVKNNPISKALWYVIIHFLEKLKKGALIINKLNISSILDSIGNAKLFTIKVLVRLLGQLKHFVSLSKSIAMLFYRMIYFVLSGHGIPFIRSILPSVPLNVDFSLSPEPIIKQIMKRVKHGEFIHSVMTGNIEKLVSSIPIVGNIYNALIQPLKEINAPNTTIAEGLVQHGMINPLISWARYGFGEGGSMPNGNICGMRYSTVDVPLLY
ncbi:hypothetical protein HHI36_020234 [Cryptolaemus montrouzieri]|uniref:Uncharacterized protein n=1 Tax=Cryptolaemus montrouzieri TaxID=559131 RepID=A0ABD2NAB5_9CUCU